MAEPAASPAPSPRPDTLNEVGVLRRREIEARIIAPLIERFAAEFGRERVVELARDVVVDVARTQGRGLAEMVGGNDLETFAGTLTAWTQDDALVIDEVRRTETEYAFNVTRCRYAEMYRALGIPELGALLSCNRDGTMIEGFNDRIVFTRTQTIMSGADHCDFHYRLDPVETPVELT
jgi:hypothetical protein